MWAGVWWISPATLFLSLDTLLVLQFPDIGSLRFIFDFLYLGSLLALVSGSCPSSLELVAGSGFGIAVFAFRGHLLVAWAQRGVVAAHDTLCFAFHDVHPVSPRPLACDACMRRQAVTLALVKRTSPSAWLVDAAGVVYGCLFTLGVIMLCALLHDGTVSLWFLWAIRT